MKGTLFFLRKPLKPVIYSLVFCVLSLVAFIFALQYELDTIAINENINNYSYVGSVYSNREETPSLTAIPENVMERIVSSKYVKDVEVRNVFSARSEKTNAILEYFITDDTIDMYGVLEGYIFPYEFNERTGVENATLVVKKNWAGVLSGQSRVDVTIWPGEEEDYCMYGENVVLIGRFNFDRENNSMNFSSMGINNPNIHSEENILDRNSVIHIPMEYEDRGAIDDYVTEKMKETGVYEYVEKLNECKYAFSVRPVTDMSMLPSFARNRLYICGGRGIEKSDAGKKVCVINQVIASKNYISVGDTIKLAVSDTNYSTDCVTHNAEWITGIPKVEDEFPEHGEFEEYEVIGFFNFYTTRNVEEDFFSFSRNDIFIPGDTSIKGLEGIKPIDFSFRLLGPDYDKFMDDMEMELFEDGYIFNMVDAGWEEFKDNYETLTTRRLVSIVSSCLFFIAALSLFTVLCIKHFRYEYGLRRLLGASTVEASKLYMAGYLVLALPALLLSLLGTVLAYDKWLVFKMQEVIDEGLPDIGGCFALMGKWAGGCFVLGLVLVTAVSWINGKKSLLRMVK